MPFDPPTPELCDDSELGYRRVLTPFLKGEGLRLDETYRLAQLPLVAPNHPAVIPEMPGRYYRMGRHVGVHSLVMMVDPDALEASGAFGALEAEVRAAPFAAKVAWQMPPLRRHRLHATLCGELPGPPFVGEEARRALAAIGPFDVEVRGLLSGNVNLGRLYLKAYPERRGGRNVLHHVQEALGYRPSDLHVVGLYNLTDNLDAQEAAALRDLIGRWWDMKLARLRIDSLAVLMSRDDLVLDAAIVETVSLVASP